MNDLRISLSNSGGELDIHLCAQSGDAEKDSLAIQALIGTWTLSVGDIIKIEELE